MSITIGIDHGYYAIKTAHCSFPAGLTSYGEHEPYTRQGLLEFGGCFFVCGSGRQPIQRDKTINDNYYLLTLAAIAKEIRQRGLPPECSVRIAAGLPLTSFGRDKPKFREYLLRSKQPVNYKFEGVEYSITIEEVAVFPQGYAALMTETGLLQDEPSIESVRLDRDAYIICNDEGKLLPLPPNRLYGPTDFFAGPFLICGDGGEDLISLTDSQITKYEKKYHSPLIFLELNPEPITLKCTPELYAKFMGEEHQHDTQENEHDER